MCKKIWEKRTSYLSFSEREEELFKDFTGARALPSGYKIKGINTTLKSIKNFIAENKPIRVIGDYDADGITSSSELTLGLTAMGAKDLKVRLPKRFTEGYGLSDIIVSEILEEGTDPGLVILVDNGIAAIPQIDTLKEAGWEVIILDHHLPVRDDRNDIILPDADIIIDPHAISGSANFEDYCGAGLVYKLFSEEHSIPEATMNKILSLAAIGTICDAVNLIDKIKDHYVYDNYLIVKKGIETMTHDKGRTTGLYSLLRMLEFDYQISGEDIGYVLGPTINAAGRLNDDGATEVYNLLIKDDNDFMGADEMATKLIEYNATRKEMSKAILPVLKERIETSHMEKDYPIIVCGQKDEIHPGLVGLIAGNLSEEYNSMVIVFTPNEDGSLLKGSGRAPEGSNLKLLLDTCADLLDRYGGHAQAAGLALDPDNLPAFKQLIKKNAGDKPESLFTSKYDFEIRPTDIAKNLNDIEKYAPYGTGHTSPIYKIVDYNLEERKGMNFAYLGKEEPKKVLKLYNKYADGINFSGKGKEKYGELNYPTELVIYGELSYNCWQGKKYPQVRFADMEKQIPLPEKKDGVSAKDYLQDLISSMKV